MKRLIQIIYSFLFLGWRGAVASAEDEISNPEDAWRAINAGALVLDVRTQRECASGTLPNAMIIPYQDIDSNIEKLLPYKSKPIVVFCAVGGRSAVAKQTLVYHGFKKVLNGGGYTDLMEHGLKAGYIA